MLKLSPARPICPMCEQEGIHDSADACITALRVAIDGYVRRLRGLPLAAFLARWTAYGIAQRERDRGRTDASGRE